MTPHDPAATQPAHARVQTPSPAVPLDLDARIEQVELRLVAREVWLRSTARSLGQRAQQAVTPRSWVLPILAGGVVLWLGWRWRHRRARALPARAALPVNTAAQRDDGLVDLPWAGLVALGWPFLPTAWRGRFSAATATAVVSAVLSVVRRLFSRRVR